MAIQRFSLTSNIKTEDPVAYSELELRFPSGSSVEIFQHVVQIQRSQTLRYFDYGTNQNMIRYGQEDPPLVNLENVQGIPIVLCLGTEDIVSPAIDINQVFIDNNIDPIVFNSSYFMGHSSALTGSDMGYLEDVYEQLQLYPPQMAV